MPKRHSPPTGKGVFYSRNDITTKTCSQKANKQMSKREEFTEVINAFKTVIPNITHKQRRGLLRQAVQNYDLSIEEASEILKSLGLMVGDEINFFEVLRLSIEEFQNQSEDIITKIVDEAHKKCYSESLQAGGRPRADGRTEEQWRTVLNQARDTLIDTHKRNAYLETFLSEGDRFEIPVDDSPQEDIETQSTEPDIAAPVILAEDTLPANQNVQTAIPESIQLIVDVPDNMTLIPTGEFQMGSNEEKANEREKPVHTVYIDGFCMDQYLVTNAQFKEFIDANPEWRKPQWFKKHISIAYHNGSYLMHWSGDDFPDEKDDHPVTRVSWYAAMAYSQWIGKRLPTEAEWEKAARGGLVSKKYPWGDLIDSTMANFGNYIGSTTDVGKYIPNGYDVFDITGNVSEWCLDEWDREFYKLSDKHNPVSGGSIENIVKDFTISKVSRVIRGGSWYSAEHNARVSNRDGLTPWITNRIVGFRCVKPITT